MKTVLQKAKEGVENGSMTMKEAARMLHKHGFTNYVDIDTTKRLLSMQIDSQQNNE